MLVMNKIFDKLINFKKIRRQRIKISLPEQISFASRLSYLLDSGIPILESIRILEVKTKSKRVKDFYKKISEDISLGRSLSQSLRPYFDGFALSVVEIGQQGGFLGSNLKYLAEELKKKKELRKGAIQALVYPSFIALSTLGIIIFLLMYIFPKILPVISGLNIKLPLSTRAVIFFSDFLSQTWFYFLILIVLFTTLFFWVLKKNDKFKFFVHKKIFRIPFWGGIYRDCLLAGFCRTFGMLLQAGLSVDRALEISESATSNLFLQSKICEIRSGVCRGGSLSSFLFADSKFFPSDISEMSAVGERTGNLASVFISLGDFYSEQFSDQIKRISSVIEPGLLVVAGLLVGFVAVSIISPVYEITKSFHQR